MAIDHKLLLKLLGDRSLDDIPNPRLRNLKEKTLRYRFKIFHVPVIRNKAADAISRHPTGPNPPDKLALLDNATSACDVIPVANSPLMGIRTLHSITQCSRDFKS